MARCLGMCALVMVLAGCAMETETRTAPKAGEVQVFDLGSGVKLEMVYVPPGSFMMGSPTTEKGRNDDETQHHVTLTQGYWMGKYEVTQVQWEAVIGIESSSRYAPRYTYEALQAKWEAVTGSGKGALGNEWENIPVTGVFWNNCKDFIQRLNGKFSGESGEFRLPTEAEWEHACRAGGTGRFYFGDKDSALGEYAWYYNNAEQDVHLVGTLRANAFGFHDMHGNVCEWCEDRYGDYPSGIVMDPPGPSTGIYRVYRGGCWADPVELCRSALRRWGRRLDLRSSVIGFRLARTEPPPGKQ